MRHRGVEDRFSRRGDSAFAIVAEEAESPRDRYRYDDIRFGSAVRKRSLRLLALFDLRDASATGNPSSDLAHCQCSVE